MATRRRNLNASGGLAVWLVVFAIWLAASASLEPVRLAVGVLVSSVIALFAIRYFPFWRGLRISPKRITAGVTFLGVFFRDMILSNLAVLGYVYARRLEISPTVVEIEIRITGRRERLLLTNALALTPGTLVIDMCDNSLTVHLLDASLAPAAEQSVRTYETLLEVAFG